MQLKRIIILLFFLSTCRWVAVAQFDVAVGEWKTHLNYTDGSDLDRIDNLIYYAAKSGGIACINTNDNSISYIDRVKGLSDVGIQCMRASQETKTLVIAYENSNIDLYHDGNVYNIPDLYNKAMAGDKTIYSIYTYGNYAYLACGFGVVVIDLKRKIIPDSWNFSASNQVYPVKDIIILPNNTIYAATDLGLFENTINNPFIRNFTTWKRVNNIITPNANQYKQLAALGNFVYVLKTDTVASKAVNRIYSLADSIWKEDTLITFDQYGNDYDYYFLRSSFDRLTVGTRYGIMSYQIDPNTNRTVANNDLIVIYYKAFTAIFDAKNVLYAICEELGLMHAPQGYIWEYGIACPAPGGVSNMSWKKSKLVTAHSVPSHWTPDWSRGYISMKRGNRWAFFRPITNHAIAEIADITIDPFDTSVVFATSFVQGLLEYRDNRFVNLYNDNNSLLENAADGSTRTTTPIFDQQENLWFGNWWANSPLIVKTKDNTWKSFSIPYSNANMIERIFIDSRGLFWLLCQRESELFLFDNNSTPLVTSDDKWLKLVKTTVAEDGDYNYIYAIDEDKDGKIWIGTDRGLRVYSYPARLLNDPSIIPSPILLTTSTESDTIVEILLNFETIKCIKVDAGNRKWIGTQNTGVFLFSNDGNKEYFHFTKENSPLLSNTIWDIEIDGETGDVYFGTDKGLISFRYTATDPKETYDDLKIFPNPVREDFYGYITIEGLKDNSEVKITDAYGGLVYRTLSNGGTAVWDGKRFNGQRAATGVYFVFINDENGKERKAGKILFIR
ncbi:MAG: T9SS type A sorting domain-containing protein [Bacteroidales bacterium]|nr:T9SS type A sorting domain-containing protein [Bacteroidales bacterium]